MTSRLLLSVEVVPHEEQRYSTCGDWIVCRDGSLAIRVSDTGSRISNLLIAVHEIVEAIACGENGIMQESVDEFDVNFKGSGEPGEDLKAPYFKQHAIADVIERLLAVEVGLPWTAHESLVDFLFEKKSLKDGGAT